MSLQGARDDHRALVEFIDSAPTSFPIYVSSFFFPVFSYLSTFNWGFVIELHLIDYCIIQVIMVNLF